MYPWRGVSTLATNHDLDIPPESVQETQQSFQRETCKTIICQRRDLRLPHLEKSCGFVLPEPSILQGTVNYSSKIYLDLRFRAGLPDVQETISTRFS